MIRPTLFIGLGTTGTKILKYLRRLMFEEFERAGLPIFRYVAIETDASETGEDPELRSNERIHVIRAVIPDTIAIERKITFGDPLYNEHLADWLEPELLRIADRSLQAGANNIRMAGRLCLWENWQTVRETLTMLLGAITAPDNISATQDLLQRHFQRRGMPIPDRLIYPVPDVYIVGTLCGGTCSGMMIDVAYYMRHIIGSAVDSNIYGIFTVWDPKQAEKPANKVKSANCYASLQELNFYNHPETTYNVTFPGDVTIREVKYPPFDYTMIVSSSGREPTIAFTTPGGWFDEEGLNQMVSLNLFADVICDVEEEKKSIQWDWRGHETFRKPKPGKPLMMRCFASFGLTAVWYPKLRIATAAACRIGSDLCTSWLRPCENVNPIEEAAQKAWGEVLDTNVEILTKPDGGESLKTQIEKLLSESQNLFAQSSSADELAKMMHAYPQGESFNQKFSKDGEYYELIGKQTPLFKDALKKALWNMLKNQANKIDFGGQYSLGDVKYFFEVIDREIQSYIEACPTRLPAFDISRLDFSNLRKAESNILLRLTFRRKSSIQQHRGELIEEYRQLVLDTYLSLRNFLIRPVLEELRAEVGILLSENPERSSILQSLETIESKLYECSERFNADYHSAIQPPMHNNVLTVANNPDNDIAIDAEQLSARLSTAEVAPYLLNEKSLFEILNMDDETLLIEMKEVFRRQALSRIEAFNVVTKAQEILNAGTENPVALLARRSHPYQEFNAQYHPVELSIRPNLICGHNPAPNLERLKTELEKKGYKFDRISESMIEHLLLLYEEVAAFALNDLSAHEMLERRYFESPGEYGHHTHRVPDRFNVEMFARQTEISRWMRAAKALLREEIFQEYPEGLFFQYETWRGLQRRVFIEDQRVVDELARHQNLDGYEAFIRSAKQKFQELGYDEVVNRIKTAIKTVGKYDEEDADLYDKLIEELFHEELARRASEEYQEEILAQAEAAQAKGDTEQTQALATVSIRTKEGLTVVIPEGTTLPCSVSCSLAVQDLTDELSPELEIFEGNRRLGRITCPIPKLDKAGLLKLRFQDDGHQLEVMVEDPKSGWCQSFNLSLSTWDQIDCTVFAPPEASLGDMFMVQAFVHLPQQVEEAEEMAKAVDDEAERRASRSLSALVARETVLTFHLVMPGLEIDDEVQKTTWLGKTTSVQFSVTVPEEHRHKTVIGTVTVSQDSVPIGQVKFKLKVVSADKIQQKEPEPTGQAVPFEVFFISYASADRPEVLKRVQMLARLGKRFFQDVLHLEPGDRWEKKLYRYIDESDAVLLFWSTNAKNSEWVLRECRYTIEKKGIDYLIPVIIEGPPPVEPPSELAELHMNDSLLYFMQ